MQTKEITRAERITGFINSFTLPKVSPLAFLTKLQIKSNRVPSFANPVIYTAFSGTGTHLDGSGVVDLIQIHSLTAKIGPIHVTIAGFPTRSPKIER